MPAHPKRQGAKGALGEIRESALLSSIAAMGAVIAVVAVIVDVQFNEVVERAFVDKDRKTSFFGQFFAALNALAVVIQLFATPRVLTRLGVGTGLMVLPLSLGVGTLALLGVPSLFAAVLPKLADGALRHSVHKAATEILFIPVPAAVQRRAKLFLDAAVDSIATGAGALLVLLATRHLGISYEGLSLASLLLIGTWLYIVRGLQRSYVDGFRQALARRELELSGLTTNISEASTLDALMGALSGRTARQQQYALDMLALAKAPRIVERVVPLLTHALPAIRLRALRALQPQGGPPLLEEVRPLLQDPDVDVQVEAVHYLCSRGPTDPVACLREYLGGEDPSLRAAAVGAIASYGSPAERQLIDDALIDGLLAVPEAESEPVRVHIARALGTESSGELSSHWQRLFDDRSERVVRQTIESAGLALNPVLIDRLFEMLDDKRYRMDARIALARYGEPVLARIAERLKDPATSDGARRILPRVLARIDSQRSVEILLDYLQRDEPAVRRAVILSLEKLRGRFPGLSFDDPRVEALLYAEVERFWLFGRARVPFEKLEATPPRKLLMDTLSQRRDDCVRHVFLLLGLRFPVRDMSTAYVALTSGRPELRASATEFLDNLLPRDLKEAIIPMFDGNALGVGERSKPGSDPLEDENAALQALMEAPDPWVRACALYATQGGPTERAAKLAQRAARDKSDLVRETAKVVLTQLSGT